MTLFSLLLVTLAPLVGAARAATTKSGPSDPADAADALLDLVGDSAVRSLLESVLASQSIMQADLRRADVERKQLRARVAALEANDTRRGLAESPASGAENAMIYRRKMTLANHTALQQHRRAEETCLTTDVMTRLDQVTEECCNEPEEDCSSGAPATCNVGCAGVVNTFWDECREPFIASVGQETAQVFEDAVHKCAVELPTDPGAREQTLADAFSLTCTGGARGAKDCIPTCDERAHGNKLLATIDGEDSTYTCEFHHGLYSWLGGGTGGMFGVDVKAFVSAVINGASGIYNVLVQENDAGVAVDLTIEPGQQVSIVGDAAVADDGGATGVSVYITGCCCCCCCCCCYLCYCCRHHHRRLK